MVVKVAAAETISNSRGQLESEDVELLFLTRVNSERLHQHDYHIVNVSISTHKSSYTVHLSKPEDLFHAEDLELNEDQAEELRCLYSGTIISGSGKKAGIASLSSCHHEKGFEGFLFLENEHFHITPASSQNDEHHSILNLLHRSQRSTIKFNHKVRHKISSPKTPTGPYIRHDTKRPSLKELQKAREEMLKNQESLEDESEDDDEDDKVEPSALNLATSSINCDSTEDPSCKSTEPQAAFAARRQNIRRKPGKKSVKRVIELAIFTDERFWRKWASMHPTDTEKKINQYILALVNNMNYLYNQPSMKEKLSFRLVNVGIQKETPKGLKATAFADNYLDSFCAYAADKNKKGTVWDHAMMLSGFDLLDDRGSPGNIGIAFTAVMCLRTLSCSLIEYRNGFESTFTAAHEIGHSLGMEHDGDDLNKNCHSSKFLMAPAAEPGQRNWSPCSNQNLANFLKSGDPRPKAKDNICYMLYCQGSLKRISEAHPALEGTSCGVGGTKRIMPITSSGKTA
ncbi:A disintegrin and metalloproteinase with thrombospondin motifs 7 [Orchesella cincta]|uniref:A disintegrin and metalloproteinase with thrombospondin motifs 7 n=1 Tax=Orchesella cincta TaxID=48709 RepID=A0A1D2NJM7_ORCCI|nr:A disintegrin and metalloproteinase with thrombospondin motifs 7 [Orchesella cincta]